MADYFGRACQRRAGGGVMKAAQQPRGVGQLLVCPSRVEVVGDLPVQVGQDLPAAVINPQEPRCGGEADPFQVPQEGMDEW